MEKKMKEQIFEEEEEEVLEEKLERVKKVTELEEGRKRKLIMNNGNEYNGLILELSESHIYLEGIDGRGLPACANLQRNNLSEVLPYEGATQGSGEKTIRDGARKSF